MLKIIALTISVVGFCYGLYSQFQARKYISKEKINSLDDMSLLARGPMPPKEILSDEGLIHYRGFCIGVSIFLIGIVIFVLISELSK